MKKERVTFNKYGLLPKGDYVYTFDELRVSVIVNGPKKPPIPGWDKEWRAYLVNQAEILLNLQAAI